MSTFRVAIGPSSFAEKDDTPLRMLHDGGCEVRPNPHRRRLTEDEIIAHLEGVDGLIAGLEPLNRKVLGSAAPRLRAVARVGIGVTNVDFDAAADFGIAVSSTPDWPIEAVAELTVGAALALCRHVVHSSAAVHRGEWTKLIGRGLGRSTVLVIGCGRIGSRVVHLLQAFGSTVLVHDPYANDGDLPAGARRVAALREGLAAADIVTLHASGEDLILGAPEFAAMKPGGLLLNAARGALVDEGALVAALDQGIVAGAWIDALWREPYAGPLTGDGRVLLTPHVGTYTVQCRRGMESEAVSNLLRDLGTTSGG